METQEKDPILFNQIRGHKSTIQALITAYQNQHLPHAMLFVGPEGIGKKMVALALAQHLLCENVTPASNHPCGHCGPCHRVAKKQSESLMLIASDDLTIKIEESRKILDFLSLSNFGKNRVIIIDKVHSMTPQAANALLKTLEEPHENVYFFLLTQEENLVLSTVRSRSQAIRFSPLTVHDLQRIYPGEPTWVYLCSRGQVSQLEKLVETDGVRKRNISLQVLGAFWDNSTFLKNESWAVHMKDRETAIEILKSWTLLFRDVLVLKTKAGNAILNLDQKNFLEKLTALPQGVIEKFIFGILQAEKDIRGYLDTTLVFESLWVKYARDHQLQDVAASVHRDMPASQIEEDT